MKKLTTQITKNNKQHTIFTMVDNQTANFVESLDEKTRHEYIVSEHEIYLNELKETRRHQSLDLSLEQGHEFVDEDSSPEEKFIENETYSELHKAISTLTEDQQWLINEVYFKGRSQVEIAKELGLSKMAISLRLQTILKKLKNFYI